MPFSTSTGTNGPFSFPTSRPSRPARNAADACLSCADTIVWLSWTDMVGLLSVGLCSCRPCRGELSRQKQRRDEGDGGQQYGDSEGAVERSRWCLLCVQLVLEHTGEQSRADRAGQPLHGRDRAGRL